MRSLKKNALIAMAGLMMVGGSTIPAFAGTVDGVINLSGDAQAAGSENAVYIDYLAENGWQNETVYQVSGDYQNMTFSINEAALQNERNEAMSDIQISFVDFYEEREGNGVLYLMKKNNGDYMSLITSTNNNFKFFEGEQLSPSITYSICVNYTAKVSDGILSGSTMTLFRVDSSTSGVATETKSPVGEQPGWIYAEGKGWWYMNTDYSYPANCWKEIDGKYYYFDANGYMLENTTTPDGYKVGSDGAWIID